MTLSLRSASGALTAFLVLQGAGLHAQTIHEFSGRQISVPWTPSQGPFGRSVPLSLSGNRIPDVVVLAGQTPYVLADADPRDAKVQLPFTALDLDALPGAAPDGADAIASVGAQGLRLHWLDVAGASFAGATLDAGAWADARLVRALEVDGDGLCDLVGIDGDGHSLLVLRAQGPALSFAPLASGTAGANVRDLCGAQWDQDPALEIVLLTDQGVEVLDADGTPRDVYSGVLPGGAIARLRQNGMATDRIAWVTAYAPPAVQMLMTLAPGGAIHDSLDLGALDVFAAVGGDYDLDGDDDLLVSHHYSSDLIWFENERSAAQPVAASFDTPNPNLTLLRVGPAGQATSNQATLVSADLDGDGDLDVLYAAQTSGTLELLRGETTDEDARKPRIAAGTWHPATGLLDLQLQAPAAGQGSATHLQVTVWRRAGLAQPYESAHVFHQKLSLSAGWPAALQIPLPETTAEFARIYAIELRLLVQDGAGKVVASRPTSVNELAGNDSNANALAAQPGYLGSLGIGTSGIAASEMSKIVLIKRPRMGAFSGGFVPYI